MAVILMGNLLSFAETELDILVKSNTDLTNRSVIEQFIPEILELVKKFGDSGQSGGSAPYVTHALSTTIEKLCSYEPLSPITGIDEEWVDVSSYSDEPMWQNKRCSSLFKYSDGNCKYIDAVIKRTPNGNCYTGGFWLSKSDYLSGNKDSRIGAGQLIQSFPFTPKTFYIDVIEEEVARDDWEMYLKDPLQLEEVYQYYKRPPITRKVLSEKYIS